MLGLSGCSKKADWNDIEGIWLDQDRDCHLEFTPHRLAVEVVRNPAQVLQWQAKLEQGVLALHPLSKSWTSSGQPPKAQRWFCQRRSDMLALTTDSRVWNLKKKVITERPREELVGLWRQVRKDDQKINYVEFTPWASVITLTWQPETPRNAAQGKNADKQIAEWWTYDSPESGVLQAEGVTRGRALARSRATYSLESNTLTLRLGSETYTLRKTDRVEPG